MARGDFNMAKLKFRSRDVNLPASRAVRLGLGIALIVLGFFGLLPVLGFWMIPLGILVLSVDLPVVRRLRRRFEVWLGRQLTGRKKNQKKNQDTKLSK